MDKWVICKYCKGDGSELRGEAGDKVRVSCKPCRGTGKMRKLSEEEAADIMEARRTYCAEMGIARGTADYDYIMKNG